MKRTLLPVILFIRYISTATAFQFGPMHAAPPISHGKAFERSLWKRQECPFGVVCGGGCAISGPCCDNITGFSCRDTETCTTVDGQLGCCPVGTTCTAIRSCLDATDPICVSGTPSTFFCCDSSAPFCNTLGTAQLCQGTRSSSTNTAATPNTVVSAPGNSTITTSTPSSAIEPTAANQNSTAAAGTQQLIATSFSQAFRPLNTSRIATTSAPIASPGLAPTVVSVTATTTTSRTSTPSAVSVASASASTSTSTTSTQPPNLDPTLRLTATGDTTSTLPQFTGGATRGCSANELAIAAVFGLFFSALIL